MGFFTDDFLTGRRTLSTQLNGANSSRRLSVTPPCLCLSAPISSAVNPNSASTLLGLLAELRRPCCHFARGARQRDRLADQADVTVLGIRHVLRDAEMLDLSVLEHLVDGIDRAAGHADRVELPDPGVARFLFSEFADLRVERVAVLGTRRRGGVFGAGRKVGRADRRRSAPRSVRRSWRC
jgi:hypothetical protein